MPQDEVGEALTEVFKEGVVKRSDVFITSKLFNSDHDSAPVQGEAAPAPSWLRLGLST